jgi:hypothetical protein
MKSLNAVRKECLAAFSEVAMLRKATTEREEVYPDEGEDFNKKGRKS